MVHWGNVEKLVAFEQSIFFRTRYAATSRIECDKFPHARAAVSAYTYFFVRSER